MPAMPLSRNFCSTSRTTTSYPACAATWAMPDPIRPQPRTPTFLIGIALLREIGAHSIADEGRGQKAEVRTRPRHPERSEGSRVTSTASECRTQNTELRNPTPARWPGQRRSSFAQDLLRDPFDARAELRALGLARHRPQRALGLRARWSSLSQSVEHARKCDPGERS